MNTTTQHDRQLPHRHLRISVLVLCMFLLPACEPISLTLLGVGASVGATHQLRGYIDRTFTASMPKTKLAVLDAFKVMGIKVESINKTEAGEVITGSTPNRQIEVVLEAVTPNTTKISAVAKKIGLFVDAATATEIIEQTAKQLKT